jgi:hypothetical protein
MEEHSIGTTSLLTVHNTRHSDARISYTQLQKQTGHTQLREMDSPAERQGEHTHKRTLSKRRRERKVRMHVYHVVLRACVCGAGGLFSQTLEYTASTNTSTVRHMNICAHTHTYLHRMHAHTKQYEIRSDV